MRQNSLVERSNNVFTRYKIKIKKGKERKDREDDILPTG